MWYDDDICFCGNADLCPHKDQCKRAERRGPGIYTMSLFYEEGKECEYFWEKENKKND